MRITTLPNLSITSNKHQILGVVCLTVQVKQMQNIPCNTNIQRYLSLGTFLLGIVEYKNEIHKKIFKLSLAICDIHNPTTSNKKSD